MAIARGQQQGTGLTHMRHRPLTRAYLSPLLSCPSPQAPCDGRCAVRCRAAVRGGGAAGQDLVARDRAGHHRPQPSVRVWDLEGVGGAGGLREHCAGMKPSGGVVTIRAPRATGSGCCWPAMHCVSPAMPTKHDMRWHVFTYWPGVHKLGPGRAMGQLRARPSHITYLLHRTRNRHAPTSRVPYSCTVHCRCPTSPHPLQHGHGAQPLHAAPPHGGLLGRHRRSAGGRPVPHRHRWVVVMCSVCALGAPAVPGVKSCCATNAVRCRRT